MRLEGGAHHMEGFAVAPIFGVEVGEDLQGFDFRVVAAPERGQRLKLGDDIARFISPSW
jgi:hypothetical protein